MPPIVSPIEGSPPLVVTRTGRSKIARMTRSSPASSALTSPEPSPIPSSLGTVFGIRASADGSLALQGFGHTRCTARSCARNSNVSSDTPPHPSHCESNVNESTPLGPLSGMSYQALSEFEKARLPAHAEIPGAAPFLLSGYRPSRN